MFIYLENKPGNWRFGTTFSLYAHSCSAGLKKNPVVNLINRAEFQPNKRKVVGRAVRP